MYSVMGPRRAKSASVKSDSDSTAFSMMARSRFCSGQPAPSRFPAETIFDHWFVNPMK